MSSGLGWSALEYVKSTRFRMLHQFFDVRYGLVAVYTTLLLEHLASLPEEVEVWQTSWNFAKICFLLYRYMSIAGLTVVMHVVSGITNSLDTTSRPFTLLRCKNMIAAIMAVSILSLAIADAMVMLRVSTLWDRQRSILALLSLSFVISCTITIVCAALAAIDLAENTIYIHICVPNVKPRVILGIWIPGMVLDLLVLTLTSLNALSRPRTQSTELTQALHKDGITFFMILAGLRFANVMMAIFSKVFLVGVCIAWTVSAMTVSRFIFHLRTLEKSQPPETSPVQSILEQNSEDRGRPSHLPQGSIYQLQRLKGIQVQGHESRSTAIDSETYAV